jgi:hypothetical protein
VSWIIPLIEEEQVQSRIAAWILNVADSNRACKTNCCVCKTKLVCLNRSVCSKCALCLHCNVAKATPLSQTEPTNKQARTHKHRSHHTQRQHPHCNSKKAITVLSGSKFRKDSYVNLALQTAHGVSCGTVVDSDTAGTGTRRGGGHTLMKSKVAHLCMHV